VKPLNGRNQRLPDFLMVGAMKSGTSTLHRVLADHPDIFLPDREVYFFDIDDIEQHRDFLGVSKGGWEFFDYEANLDRYLEWYRALFSEARPDQRVGERSTTYLPSRKAPGRIARLLPDARILVVLRDPVKRAYSHYWHLVRVGTTNQTFEDAIRTGPLHLIQRGLYREQLESYHQHFPADQIRVVVFEKLVRDMAAEVASVCRFLEVDPPATPPTADGVRENAARVPSSLAFQLMLNRVLGGNTTARYGQADLPERSAGKAPPLASRLRRQISRVNLRSRRYPAMPPDAREFLERYYRQENRGLSGFAGCDLGEFWPHMAA